VIYSYLQHTVPAPASVDLLEELGIAYFNSGADPVPPPLCAP